MQLTELLNDPLMKVRPKPKKTPKGEGRGCNIYLTYQGKTQSMSEWAKELRLSRNTLYSRYKNGWEDEEILTKPVDSKHRPKKYL